MSKQVTTAHAVMEGGGSYNAHAKSQATGGMLGLPFLEQAVREMTIPEKNETILIADYGSSQGKNSLTPMRVAIRALRARVGADRPISVTHIDQPANDADGYFWFKGRKKEIIVRAGSNVSPQEVEEVIYQHPDVFEAGVVREPDPVYGERVVAFVSPRNGNTPGEQELREYARKSLADYKVPEKIFFLPQLPKGPTGKVHRATLKAMLIEKKP
jgi:AMP-binding enzyme C-terminal domain